MVADDVYRVAIAIADGEMRPVGRNTRVEGELVTVEAEAEDVLDTGLVGPRGGTSVPCPAATTRMLWVGVDVGSDAVGLDFVFEHVG